MLLNDNKIKTWYVFLSIVTIELIVYYFTNNYIMTKDFYIKLLENRLTTEMINTQFEISKRFSVYGYLFVPLVTLIKISLFTLFIQFPLLFKFIDIPYKKLFRICTFAIIPFLFLQIITTWHIANIPLQNISQKTLSVIPFSINSLLNPEYYSKTIYQFLGSFHIFWILWGVIIYFGLIKTKKIERIDSLVYTSLVYMTIVLFRWGISTYTARVFG